MGSDAPKVQSRQRSLPRRFAKFAFVGGSGVIVNLGTFYVLAEMWGLPDLSSYTLAIELSIIWNFLLNNVWTFRDRNEAARAGFFTRMGRYNLVSLAGLGIQLATFACMKALVLWLFGLGELGALRLPLALPGIGLAMVWNFLSNFKWTWAQRSKDDDEVTR